MVSKEVQNQLGSSNLNLFIFNCLKAGLRPSKICEKYGLKKTAVQYHLSMLKQAGLIEKVGYGVWEILKEFDEKEVQKTTRVTSRQLGSNLNLFKQDRVRGHAFQFKIKLPELRNWKNREKLFLKKDIKFEPLLIGGINRGQKLEFKGRKIWLTNKSIVIYEKSSYLADNSKEAQERAIQEMLSLMKSLEKYLQANFKTGKYYKFKVSRQHYSLVKNALAQQYDKEGNKLQVFSEDGLWFLIDNSYNLHEAETVHPKTSVEDNRKVQNYFNGIKKFEDYTPQFVVNSMQGIQNNQLIFAKNIDSHIKAIQDISSATKILSEEIIKLRRTINKNGN
ncbi:MAG TPA: winged helix-turn-helix domain-containing protein [Candidatus Pacearchaeota archaeon]|nr:winged helix-turn-helix domain-containing protein [Candidatus Pacearchaeota archaeon]